MSAVLEERPRPAAAPANEAEMRAALAWETGQQAPDDKSTWAWLWESIQGDFNDKRSTGQIAFDAAVSMVPVVDQICDARDLIANCRAIATSDEKEDNTWKWVALALTLVGLIPTLGSLVKGVLKIVFAFVRRHGIDRVDEAIDLSMTWVITFLRKKEVQDYLRAKNVDAVFKWLADAVRKVQKLANTRALLAAFDSTIGVMKGLLQKMTWLPVVGEQARKTIDLVERVRQRAPQPLARVDALLQRILGALARRLDMEQLLLRHGILNANNVHFRGALPEARAVTLMRGTEPRPAWLGNGRHGDYAPLKVPAGRNAVSRQRKLDPDYPDLNDTNIASFHKMAAVEIKGPARLYRVVSPTNGAMGDCWIPEDVWQKLLASPDPKTAWRKHLAVWPDWNPDSQFVVMTIPPGQTVKVWRGPASTQAKDARLKLDAHLEGGWDQVIMKVSPDEYDTTRIYRLGETRGAALRRTDMTHSQYRALPKAEQAKYAPVRERINQPNLRGPFDTGWGATDFDPQLTHMRIGLPSLPGQVTN